MFTKLIYGKGLNKVFNRTKVLSAFFLSMSIYITAYTMPAFDNEFECTKQEKADQYIKDFKINTRSFGGVELCNPQKDTKRLFNDFEVIESGQFQNEASHLLVGNFVPTERYYSWLKSQTYGMNRGNDIPFATAYNRGGYFTMQDGWAQLSTLGRVGVVIHEARHTEGYRHIPCTYGPYAKLNLDGCDSTFRNGGSHAVEMEYYARVVVYGQNFHPLYKKMARLMALGRSNFVFNQKIIQPREALFLITKDGSEARLFDQENIYTREVAGTGQLKRTSFGPTLFNPNVAYSLDPYELSGDTRPTEDGYSYFKLLSLKTGLPSGQAPLDLEEYDLVNKRYLAGIDIQNRFGFYNFGEGKWGAFSNIPEGKAIGFKTQYKDTKGLFIILDNGKLLQVNPEKNSLSSTKIVWDTNQISFINAPQGQVLQLQIDGILSTLDGIPWAPAQDAHWSQAVNIPMYNGFEVR